MHSTHLHCQYEVKGQKDAAYKHLNWLYAVKGWMDETWTHPQWLYEVKGWKVFFTSAMPIYVTTDLSSGRDFV